MNRSVRIQRNGGGEDRNMEILRFKLVKEESLSTQDVS